MICEDPTVCESLRRVVRSLCRRGELDDDLMQEALIWLCVLEQRQPGQTLSWYLQGCRFHLLNQLAAGRSLDAPKRERGRLSFCSRIDQECFLRRWETETAVMPEFTDGEALSLLMPCLTVGEREVLDYLASGLGAREIARRLGVSHQAVVKKRQRIAAIARQVGLMPPAPGPNGSKPGNGSPRPVSSSRVSSPG